MVASCGGETLKTFRDRDGGNARYTSKMSVVEFVNALGTWMEESTLKRLHRHTFFSIMADECTDVTTIEELTICWRWVVSGVPEEHFIEILTLKKANAEGIYSALVEYCGEKNIQLGKLIGMGFDGAATFSGDKTGVQRRLKELSPHALFVHCCCHVLQLASVQAANATPAVAENLGGGGGGGGQGWLEPSTSDINEYSWYNLIKNTLLAPMFCSLVKS